MTEIQTPAPVADAKPMNTNMADGRVLSTFPLKFRKKKEKGADGSEVITQREGFQVSIAYHTLDTLLEHMVGENSQVKDYVVSLVNNELYKALRAAADENGEAKSFADLSSINFTIEQLAKDAASGSGGKPESAAFDAFCVDYIKAMPVVAGISTTAAQQGASEFKGGNFTRSKFNEKTLASLAKRLVQYKEGAPNAADHEDTVGWLENKIVKLIEGASGGDQY